MYRERERHTHIYIIYIYISLSTYTVPTSAFFYIIGFIMVYQKRGICQGASLDVFAVGAFFQQRREDMKLRLGDRSPRWLDPPGKSRKIL